MRLSPALALLTGCAGYGLAQESFTVGPRALGMGGTGVAVVDDLPAQYYNPAAFGFFAYQPPAEEQSDKGPFSVDNNALWRKDWGAAADFTFGARIHKDFAEHVDTLVGYSDDGTLQNLGDNGVTSEADALALVQIANALGNLQDPDNAMSIDATGGVSVRIKHFGIGVRTYSQVHARLRNLDTTNLGIGTGSDLDTEMAGVVPDGWSNAYTPQVFSQSQQDALINDGVSSETISKLDYLAAQSGVTGGQTGLLVDTLLGVNNGSGDLDNNTSALRLYGASIMEIPVSFGWAFNENIAIGGNLKAMIGRVYGTDVLVFEDDIGDALRDVDRNYEQTTTWGIDLAVMVRMKMFNLGLTGRNLNSPTFDGPTVNGVRFPDYEIEPTITAGVGFIPFETLVFAADLDLTENETVMSSYKSRYVRLGGEWDIMRILAVRVGYSQNLAESDVGSLIHAGLGVNLWALRIDLAGSMALETATYDGEEVPRESRVGFQLAADF